MNLVVTASDKAFEGPTAKLFHGQVQIHSVDL